MHFLKLPHQLCSHVLSLLSVTCPTGEGIIVCGGSFGTWFLFIMKDCAGLRLIWNDGVLMHQINHNLLSHNHVQQ